MINLLIGGDTFEFHPIAFVAGFITMFIITILIKRNNPE